MLNEVTMVGKLVDNPLCVDVDKDNKKYTYITIAVPRCYKNKAGLYETDYIDWTLIGVLGENTYNFCKKGDLIGIKGRVQTTKIENNKVIELMAEKITFLSSNKEYKKDKEK